MLNPDTYHSGHLFKGIFLFFLTLSLKTVCLAGANSFDERKVQEIAHSAQWQSLLYYQPSSQSLKSRVTNPKYFVDKENGATDPRRELQATLDLLVQDLPKDDNHPQCLFPARYHFLKKIFALPGPIECPQFHTWLNSYQPEDLVLVYASQYIANPASVFGHSFFLVTSKKQTKGFWLTYNYAATIPPETSGLGYVWGGLTGWFEGDYSVMPLYSRLTQYGSVENRDLWLYKMKLNPEELEFFIRHLWELVHASRFTYYFMNENCAGIMQRTLSAVLPEMGEVKSQLYVHPIEVIRALDQKGRIKDIDFIPSEGELLAAHVRGLDSEQKQEFRRATDRPNSNLENLDSKSSEALVQYTSFLAQKNGGQIDAKYKKLERDSYIQRAKFTDPPLSFPTNQIVKNAPHLSHASFALNYGASLLNGKTVGDLGFRFATHSALDPDPGFLKNSTIEFMHVNLSANEKSIWFRDLTIVGIESYQPYRFYDPNASWRIQVALKENRLTELLTDQFAQLHGAFGITLDGHGHYYYALLRANVNAGRDLPQDCLEIGPELGAIFQWSQAKLKIEGSAGKGINDSSDYVNVTTGFSWALKKNLSLIQEYDWKWLAKKDLSGTRASLNLRSYF